MYIRYDGKIEDRANGQQEIAGNIPTYSKMKKNKLNMSLVAVSFIAY